MPRAHGGKLTLKTRRRWCTVALLKWNRKQQGLLFVSLRNLLQSGAFWSHVDHLFLDKAFQSSDVPRHHVYSPSIQPNFRCFFNSALYTVLYGAGCIHIHTHTLSLSHRHTHSCWKHSQCGAGLTQTTSIVNAQNMHSHCVSAGHPPSPPGLSWHCCL